jgi:hypothetical protein
MYKKLWGLFVTVICTSVCGMELDRFFVTSVPQQEIFSSSASFSSSSSSAADLIVTLDDDQNSYSAELSFSGNLRNKIGELTKEVLVGKRKIWLYRGGALLGLSGTALFTLTDYDLAGQILTFIPVVGGSVDIIFSDKVCGARCFSQQNTENHNISELADNGEDTTVGAVDDSQSFLKKSWKDVFNTLSDKVLFRKQKLWLYRAATFVGLTGAAVIALTDYDLTGCMLSAVPAMAAVPDLLVAFAGNGKPVKNGVSANVPRCCLSCTPWILKNVCFNSCFNRLDFCCHKEESNDQTDGVTHV